MNNLKKILIIVLVVAITLPQFFFFSPQRALAEIQDDIFLVFAVKDEIGNAFIIFTNTTTSHIFLPDGSLIATVEGNGEATTTNYVLTDHLGGTNVVID